MRRHRNGFCTLFCIGMMGSVLSATPSKEIREEYDGRHEAFFDFSDLSAQQKTDILKATLAIYSLGERIKWPDRGEHEVLADRLNVNSYPIDEEETYDGREVDRNEESDIAIDPTDTVIGDTLISSTAIVDLYPPDEEEDEDHFADDTETDKYDNRNDDRIVGTKELGSIYHRRGLRRTDEGSFRDRELMGLMTRAPRPRGRMGMGDMVGKGASGKGSGGKGVNGKGSDGKGVYGKGSDGKGVHGKGLGGKKGGGMSKSKKGKKGMMGSKKGKKGMAKMPEFTIAPASPAFAQSVAPVIPNTARPTRPSAPFDPGMRPVNPPASTVTPVADPTLKPSTPPRTERPSTPPRTERPSTPPRTERPSTPPRTERPSAAPRTERPSAAPRTSRPSLVDGTDTPSAAPRTDRPSNSPRTDRPSTAARTRRPSVAPQSESPTEAGQTESPTEAGQTESPTQADQTESPTQADQTESPTQADQTESPTQADQTESPTQAMETEAPTQAMETEAPTQAIETEAPTQAIETEAPTQAMETEAPTQAPTENNGTDAPSISPSLSNGATAYPTPTGPFERCFVADSPEIGCPDQDIGALCDKYNPLSSFSACFATCIDAFCCIHDSSSSRATSCSSTPNCVFYDPCYIIWFKLHDTIGPAPYLRLDQNEAFYDVNNDDFIQIFNDRPDFFDQLFGHHFMTDDLPLTDATFEDPNNWE